MRRRMRKRWINGNDGIETNTNKIYNGEDCGGILDSIDNNDNSDNDKDDNENDNDNGSPESS